MYIYHETPTNSCKFSVSIIHQKKWSSWFSLLSWSNLGLFGQWQLLELGRLQKSGFFSTNLVVFLQTFVTSAWNISKAYLFGVAIYISSTYNDDMCDNVRNCVYVSFWLKLWFSRVRSTKGCTLADTNNQQLSKRSLCSMRHARKSVVASSLNMCFRNLWMNSRFLLRKTQVFPWKFFFCPCCIAIPTTVNQLQSSNTML